MDRRTFHSLLVASKKDTTSRLVLKDFMEENSMSELFAHETIAEPPRRKKDELFSQFEVYGILRYGFHNHRVARSGLVTSWVNYIGRQRSATIDVRNVESDYQSEIYQRYEDRCGSCYQHPMNCLCNDD